MNRAILIIGDSITLLLVTLFGFSFHENLDAGPARWASTFVPLGVSWAILGLHLGVFRVPFVLSWSQLWRSFWAMALAAPLAGLLRGLWLGGVVLPAFVLIIGGISALALTLWRACFLLIKRWMNSV